MSLTIFLFQQAEESTVTSTEIVTTPIYETVEIEKEIFPLTLEQLGHHIQDAKQTDDIRKEFEVIRPLG